MTGTRQTEILIATRNEGKIREIKHALNGLPLRLRLLNEFPELRAINEVGTTYEENATLKALHYSRQTTKCAWQTIPDWK
jgi:XTP/dITP diphosphohydrolase